MIVKRLAALLPVVAIPACYSQVVLDGKFGSTGPVTGPNYEITSGMGAVRGNNLFHSFSQFDLKAGDTANFTGPANIQNILSRVTGTSGSTIDGTIHSGIAGANFFFINPNGVIFGPNAKVDVSGAFAASTANYLALADGARFVASIDADDSKLTTSPVASFGFLDGPPGTLEVHGSLKSADGATLSLVGGNVTVGDGSHLTANGSQILVKGVTGPAEVPFSSSASSTMAAASPVAGTGSLPPVSGNEAANVVIRGGRLTVENALVTSGAGGVDLKLTEAVEVIRGGQITAPNPETSTSKGGNIIIQSPTVLLNGFSEPAPARIAADTSSKTVEGKGGDIVIRANSVELRDDAEISVSSFGAADAGLLDIDTTTLRLRGADIPMGPTQLAANAAPVVGTQGGSGGGIIIHAQEAEISNGAAITAFAFGDPKAGSITMNIGNLSLENGGITTYTAGAGQGGEIRIRADRLTLDGAGATVNALTTSATGGGNGGVIDITAGRLELRNDGGISAVTYGDGRGGDVRVSAGSILMDGTSGQPFITPGISAASQVPFAGSGGGGQGGDVNVSAGLLNIRNGMPISASTATAGNGGSVFVTAKTILMDSQGAIQSASTASGRAGSVTVTSDQDVLLAGNSSISTSALQSSGGNINVRAGHEVRLYENSQINAQAGPGGGGNIAVRAPQMVYLLDSTLTAQAVGDGGNLTIDPVFIILNRSSLVSKSASANGGNISILSDYFFQSDTVIDASAPLGIPGTVTVTAPQIDLSGSLIALPANLLSLETQLRPDCGIRLSGNVSSFIVVGRGGLPLAPGGFVPSAETTPLDDVK